MLHVTKPREFSLTSKLSFMQHTHRCELATLFPVHNDLLAEFSLKNF